MSKAVKILSSVFGAVVAAVGLAWAVLEIAANHGINHLFDKTVKN